MASTKAKGDEAGAVRQATMAFTLSGEVAEKMAGPLGVLRGGREPENAFELWISMFPTAPLLGVRWMMRDVVFGGPAADTPAAQESARLAVDAARVAATDAEAGAPAAAVEEARPSSPAKLRVVEGGGDKPAAAEEAAAPAATATPDDLQRIKGVGPRLAEMLRGQGVTTFAQIAAMTDADLDALDEKLGAFRGRSKRDDWVSQAKALMAG